MKTVARIQMLISSLALLTPVFQPAQSQSDRSSVLLDKLASAVLRSESQALIASLSDILAKPELERNPRKLKTEIVRVLKDPKFQAAVEGRKTVKAIKLPPAIVKILNAKIPVKTKKQVLDNVLKRIPGKKKTVAAAGISKEKLSLRDEKSVKFPEAPVTPVTAVVPLSTGYLAADIAPPQSDAIYFGDLPDLPDADNNKQPSGSDQTFNNQISQTRPGSGSGSSAISPLVSGPNSDSSGGSSGAAAAEEPGEENNYGFPLRLGRAGVDFPIFSRENIPQTSFSCDDKADGGYYADLDAQCQLYHVCYQGKKFTELCPNGTVYDQGHFTCANWRKVDCSEQGLQLSNELLEDFFVERKFVTENLDVINPEVDLPWRNRNT